MGLISSHNICPMLFVNSRIGGCHPALVFCMKILSCLGIRLFPYKESLELLNVIMITRTVTVTENVDSYTIWGLAVIMQFLERSSLYMLYTVEPLLKDALIKDTIFSPEDTLYYGHLAISQCRPSLRGSTCIVGMHIKLACTMEINAYVHVTNSTPNEICTGSKRQFPPYP